MYLKKNQQFKQPKTIMTTTIFLVAITLLSIWCGVKIAEFIMMQKMIFLKNQQIKQLKMKYLILKQKLIITELLNQ